VRESSYEVTPSRSGMRPADGRRIVSQDSPSGVSRIGGQAGTQAPTLRPYHHKAAEAGPEALSTFSLPNRRDLAA